MSPRIEIIGDATLYMGDCREIVPTLPLADVLITDPPYKVTSGGFGDLEGGFGGWIKDSYDNKGSIVECDIDWSDWLKIMPAALAPDAQVYVFSNDRNLPIAWAAAEGAGFKFHRLLTWDKRAALPNRWYQQTCEFVWFGRQGKAFMINDPSSKALQSIFQRDESAHPTEKPVGLCQLYVENSTAPGGLVLDPFMGSGTTGVAAIRSGRRFIGCELTQQWFDVACERLTKAMDEPRLFASPPPRLIQTDIFAANEDRDETFSLRCKTHTATIRLAPVEGGWTFAASCARMFGDFSGWSEPMGRSGGVLRRFALTRADALEAASAVVRARLPDQPIIDWLDSLAPDQPDLFGAAA